MELRMTRVKRWISMHKKEFLPDGTLKEEARTQLLAQDVTDAAIDSYAARLKAQYDEWKRLDETDPERWIEYTAWDLFSEEEKQKFNRDGSLKPEYIENARRRGASEGYLAQLEYKKKRDIDDFNRMSASYAENGENFGEYLMQSRMSATKDYAERQKQLGQDICNGEEISSLPFDVEPDEYYQQHGYSPSRHG